MFSYLFSNMIEINSINFLNNEKYLTLKYISLHKIYQEFSYSG
jgi:hypothetical protein